MSSIKEYLNTFYSTPKEVLDAYLSCWREYKASKKSLITSPGKTEKYLYYTMDGVQKSFYLKNDKEHIITFAYSPSFSGILESFFNQTPSRYYLETITDSVFKRISYDQHNMLLQQHKELETLFRKIAERFLDGVIQRQHELMALNMEERFSVFVKRSPHMLHLVSQKDIASYLRIDPTNFSKMINRIQI